MPSHDHMVSVVHAYLQAFQDDDPRAASSLYAEDATIEDPVGAAPRIGAEAIEAFYADVIEVRHPKMTLQGPVRTAANFAAFPMTSVLKSKKGPLRIEIIDVFEFDDAGKIKSMRAFWSRDNTELLT